MSAPSTRGAPGRRPTTMLARCLIALGIVGILWGVFHVLRAVDPPGQRTFEDRVPYNEAKRVVHERFPGALARSLAGLALAMFGARLARRGEDSKA